MTHKILVNLLDDAETDREFIMDMLAENDLLEVSGFCDGDTFRESLNKDVSMVITDVRVPGYNVFECIEYMRDHFPGIYIIVISAWFDDEIYERLFEYGVDRVVKKGTSMAWINKIKTYVDQLLPKIINKQTLLQ